jgi:RecA/RadA recombinase
MDAIKHARVAQFAQTMQRNWGKPSLQPLRSLARHQVISTGYSELDHALGIGGLPTKSLIALHGHPDSGIATLAYHLIAAFQTVEKFVIYLDIAQTFDPEYAVKSAE